MTDSPCAVTARTLVDWRCSHCGQLLAKVDVRVGKVEIICRKCKPKRLNLLEVKESK